MQHSRSSSQTNKMTIAAIRGPVTQSHHPQSQSQSQSDSQWKVWSSSSQQQHRPVLPSRRHSRHLVTPSSRRQSWIIIYALLIMMTTSICVHLMHQCWQFQISAYTSNTTNMNDQHGSTSQSQNEDDHEDNDNDSNDNDNTHNNVKKMVLVHLGKTAGSSITCMLHPSLYKSGKGNSQCDPSDYRPSAIANNVNKRIHLEPAPVDDYDHDHDEYKYDDFLITVRNPIERIVSWFYYMHPSYPPQKLKRHISGCDGYSTIFQCWDSIQAMAEDGLSFDFGISVNVSVSAAAKTETNRNSTANTTTWTNTTSKSDCQWLAQELVLGTRKCWHNYYNYNFTYGRLLQEAASASTSSSDQKRSRNRSRNITIYAIRTEHLEEDWGVIDRMLGGDESDSDSNSDSDSSHSLNVKSLRKNSWREGTGKSSSSKVVPNTTLSYAGRSNLCRALCNEIQIYKELLHLAINIDRDGENESLDELIATCPDESREIRDCPLIHDRDHDHDLDGLE